MNAKYLSILFFAALLSGCAYTQYTPYVPQFQYRIADFREYSKDGFYISTTATGFEYIPVAYISVEKPNSMDAYEYNQLQKNMSDNDPDYWIGYYDKREKKYLTKDEFIDKYGIQHFEDYAPTPEKIYKDQNATSMDRSKAQIISDNDGLRRLVDYAKSLGADCILEYRSTYSSISTTYYGFAVKRVK